MENIVRILGILCRCGEGDNLGTFSLPLEDQEWRINEHNIRKLGRNLGEIQGGFPPLLTLKGSQRILMSSPPTIQIQKATKHLKTKSTQTILHLESSGLITYFLGSCWLFPLRINKVDQEIIRVNSYGFWSIWCSPFHSIPCHSFPFY